MLIPIGTLTPFFATSIVLALTPGPDNIFVLTHAAIRGWLVGFVITLGLCTGLVGHTLAVASGVVVIFQASFIAFTTLKLIGAIYLLYLAFRFFRTSAIKHTPSINDNTSLLQLYRRGIIMNITNPKVSIFFLSFLPQFADPSRGSLMLQMLIFGFVFIIAAILVFGMISIFAGLFGAFLQYYPRAQTAMNRVTGTIYVAMAIKLAMETM